MVTHRLLHLLTVSIALFVSASALNGCGIVTENDSKKSKIKRYFIHGDPKSLYAGASLNETSFIAIDELDSFSNFDLRGTVVFYDKEELVPVESISQEDLEKGQEASTGDELESHSKFAFDKLGDDAYIYRDQRNKGDSLAFSFSQQSNRLELSGLVSDETTEFKLEPIHYSINSAKDTFSILASGEDSSGKFIAAFFFVKNISNDLALLDNVDEKFNYLLGPGIRARWQNEINIDICGDYTASEMDYIESSIHAWETEEGKLGSQSVVISKPTKYFPFSDVNQHCYQLVDNFLFEDSEDSAVGGITLTVVSKTERVIKTSHVFISLKGIEKANGGHLSSTQLERTTVHEMGHFYGLDHEFDKDADGNYIDPSIMGYDSSVIYMTEHDKAAIRALYDAE